MTSLLPWALRRQQPQPSIEVVLKLTEVEAERDQLQAEMNALLIAQRELLRENRELRSNARLSEPDDVRKLRRQAEQDRRNVVVVSDALVLAEGRDLGAPLPDAEVAAQLRAEVRTTVAAFLHAMSEGVR